MPYVFKDTKSGNAIRFKTMEDALKYFEKRGGNFGSINQVKKAEKLKSKKSRKA